MANLSGLHQSRWVETDLLRGESMTGVGGVPMPRRMVDELLRPEDPWRSPWMDESTSSTARVLFGAPESRLSGRPEQGTRGSGLNRRYGEGISATDALRGAVKRHISGYSVFDPDGRVPAGETPPAPTPQPAPNPVDVWNAIGGASRGDMQTMTGPAYRTPEPYGYPAAEQMKNTGFDARIAMMQHGDAVPVDLGDGTTVVLSATVAAKLLPRLKGRTASEIAQILQQYGYMMKGSRPELNESYWLHPDGSESKIHPFAHNSINHLSRAGSNAHVHKIAPGRIELNDRGIATDRKKYENSENHWERRFNDPHIGIRNPADFPVIRGRAHGMGPVSRPKDIMTGTYRGGYKVLWTGGGPGFDLIDTKTPARASVRTK